MPERLKPADAELGRKRALALISRPKYLAMLEKKADEGILPPPVETDLWNRAFGKTKELIQVERLPDVTIVHKLRQD